MKFRKYRPMNTVIVALTTAMTSAMKTKSGKSAKANAASAVNGGENLPNFAKGPWSY